MAKDSADAESIFNSALGKATDAERSAYLDGACGDNTVLRDRVAELLRAHQSAGSFLKSLATMDPSSEGAQESVASASAPLREAPGTRIGPYKLLQLIGEGGFGSVFMAEQEKPVQRKVALKIIKLGMDTRQVVARFEQERQALAMMDHPSIAKVFDAGATDTGRPYFAMELCKGQPITDYCDKNNLGIEQRLELFAQVCSAVQHAHTKGIIHRDIKPSNVLVHQQDDRPHAKVIDFGIAKATASKLTEKTLFTEHHQMVGTPQYMSPEQAEGSLDIDTRTDVYSLGVLLYELLTGATPFDAQSLHSAAYGEIQRIIREVDPPKPSTRLSQNSDTIASVAANRRTEPRKLGTIVRGELDWIVMKALEKNRSRRYETANGLAMDIQRYLAGDAIVAAPPSATYRFRKFVRRNKGLVAAASVVAATLLLGIVGTTWGMVQAERSRRHAVVEAERAEANAIAEAKARARAEAISSFVNKALRSGDPMQSGKRDTTIAEAMGNAVREIDAGRFKDDPQTEADLRDSIGLILKNNGRYADAKPLLEQALALRERVQREDTPALALSLNNLAHLNIAQGELSQAEPLLKRSLEIFEKTLGPDHPDVAAALNSIAVLYYTQSKYALAEPLFKRALAIREKILDPYHRDVALSLNDLALLYSDQSQYALAEPLMKRSLAIYERTLGPDHPDVAASLNSLATLYEDQRQYDLAEPLYKRALAICENALGSEHPLVATSLHNLAEHYREQEQYTQAEPLYTRALAIREKAMGPDHGDVGVILNNLALVYKEMRRYAEAEQLYMRTLAIDEKNLGPDDPEVANDLNNLASLYRDENRFLEAEQFFVRAIAIYEKTPSADPLITAVAVTNLARARQSLGKTADARLGFDAALVKLRRLSPEGSPTLARVLWRSGSARLDNKDAAAALPELEQAVAMAEKILPSEDPQLIEYRQTLSKCKSALADKTTPAQDGENR